MRFEHEFCQFNIEDAIGQSRDDRERIDHGVGCLEFRASCGRKVMVISR